MMTGAALPMGWTSATIGDVTEVVDKIDPRKVPDREVQYVDISSVDNVRNRVQEPRAVWLSEAPSRARQIVRGGDVLFSLVRPYLGNIAAVPSELDEEIASTGFCVLRSNGAVDPRYLLFKTTSREFINSVAENQYGVSYPAVNEQQIRSQPVEVPPIEEQRRIVEKIDTLFAELDKGEESLRQVQTLLARYRQSVLKAAVTGELTADWRAERAGKLEHGRDLLERILQTRRETWEGRGSFKEPSSPATDDLPGLPDGWVWCSTEQLAQVQTGATPRKAESRFYAGGKVPWITSTAVNSELITEPQDYITDAAIVETNAKLFPAGTLIVAMYGEGKTRGKVSQLGIDAATNQACAALLVEHLPAPVRDFLKTFYLYNYESIRLLSSGGVQPNLNLGLISRTAVPLASEEELSEIGRRIETEFMRIREAEDHCEAAGKRSTALRQSILKEAFSGRLIPQNPNDEPASELLARIRRSQEAGRAAKR